MEKTATIRPYQQKDYENLREVCFVTATPPYNKNKDITAALFCEYYLNYEGEHCFVVADQDDNAVGYILCAPDYTEFVKKFTKYQLPIVRKLSFKEYVLHKLEFMYNKKVAKDYPAHLHIDIMPDFQRMGMGKKLVDALMAHLNSIGVQKLHLGCGASNEKGTSFYKKIGFHIVKTVVGVNIFGVDVHKYVEDNKLI
jgi:ribosomal protein S18 acetylase RimI-like enzyme